MGKQKVKQKKQTGIFLPHFQGLRLADFPLALEKVLDKDNIHYYDGVYAMADGGANYVRPVEEEILLAVHSPAMLSSVKKTSFFEAALYSAGGTVQAALEIVQGIIDNAFVFTGVGDHHAGRDFYGGMCYFNGAAIAIAALRKRGLSRFAIVDTDSHHADGTRDIFAQDQDVLHICFCYQNHCDNKNNVDVLIPYQSSDDYYLQKLEQELMHRLSDHRPEIIFWEFGYDATQGEYGDKGLTKDCHLKIARIIKSAADDVCLGRLITILCGGSGRALAAYIIPGIIALMSEHMIMD